MTFPATLVYTDADFRLAVPYYADTTAFPQAQMQNWFTIGTNYISDANYGGLRDGARQYALYLMTAHLQNLSDQLTADGGAAGGLVTQATVDKVSVTIQPPPNKSQFEWWLNQTSFGQQLFALLSKAGVGGKVVGGKPELRAFRAVCGSLR